MSEEIKPNDEVLAVYVKSFSLNSSDDGDMGGHLKVGGVYLCYKHDFGDKDLYRIYFNDSEYRDLDGIFVKDLNEDNESWNCSLEIIDLNNLEEYNLTSNQLDYVLDIAAMTTEDAKKFMNSEDFPTGNTLLDAIMEQLDGAIEKSSPESIKTVNITDSEPKKAKNTDISSLDGVIGTVLGEISEHLDRCNNDKYADTAIDTTSIILDDKMGKGFNIGNATKYLSRYTTEGYEKSANRKDLLKSIHYIIFELARTLK